MSARSRRTAAILVLVLSALAALPRPATPAAVGTTPVVVGIVLRETGPAFAVIQDPATSKTSFYGVGARVGAAVVKEILADRVILVTGDQHTHLRLATSSVTGAGSGSGASRGDASGARQAGRSSAGLAEPPSSPYGNIAIVTAAAGPSTGGTNSSNTGGASESPMAGVGQSGGPGGESTGSQNGLSASLTLTGRMQHGGSQQGVEFSTTSLRDLLIAMSYSNVTGSHRQRIELYAPDGSLYQRFTGAVAPSTQTLVPVGGTWITEHSLFGSWRVDVYVDRETTPIVSQAFTLNP
jgi:hypothetical protein